MNDYFFETNFEWIFWMLQVFEWIVKQILNEYRVTEYKGELFLIFYENIRVNSVELLLLFKYALQIQNDGEKKKTKKRRKRRSGEHVNT